jgi:hypothetical protein
MNGQPTPHDWTKLKEELIASGILPMREKVIAVVMPDKRWRGAPASLLTSSTDGIHPVYRDHKF